MPIKTKEFKVPWNINFGNISEKRSFTLERKVYEPETEPRLLYSPSLSNETELEIYVLDYSNTDVHTHKLEKALETVNQAKENNKRIIFFISPYFVKRKDSKGSGRDALELASAVNYPESQVISFVHSKKPYFKIEPIHPYFPNSRQSVEVGIDLSRFVSPEDLGSFFYNAVKGEMNSLKEFLESRDLEPLNRKTYVAATNLLDFLEEHNVYCYSDDLVNELKKFDFTAGSAGTGERARGQIKSIEGKKPFHIIVVSKGHALDPFHKFTRVGLSKIETPYFIEEHRRLVEEASKRENVIFKFVTQSEVLTAKKLFADKLVEEHSELRPRVRTSPDGAVGFSILRSKYESIHGSYFTEKGLRVLNTYRFSKDYFDHKGIEKGIVVPYGSKVCIINTGCSNNYQLKKLIETGIVK